MSKRIDYSVYLNTIDVTYDFIEKWTKIVCKYFKPQWMKIINHGNHRKFNEKKLFEIIKQDIKDEIQLRFDDGDGGNTFDIIHRSRSPHITSMGICLEDVNDLFLDRAIDELMSEKGIVAYKRSSKENYLQNIQFVNMYKWEGGRMRDVKTKYSKTFNEKVIDTEYNPGHSHYYEGIKFSSCYQMWFGRPFYQYIEKEKLKSFKNCYENVELDNEVIRIRLYENIWDYDKRKAKKIQWDFRRSVGIDVVAHRLEGIEAKRPVTNAAIEMFMGSFPNGGTKLIKSYFDDKNNNVPKDKATKVRICEVSDKGEMLSAREERL